MALTKHDLKRFTEAIKPSKKKDKKTVKATVTNATENAVRVRIDGSKEETAVSSVSSVKANDRVIVDVDNHNAMIVGNITDKSASSSDMDGVVIEVQKTKDGLSSKVSKGDVVSEINQSPSSVKISAEKIDFNGLATFVPINDTRNGVKITMNGQGIKVEDIRFGVSSISITPYEITSQDGSRYATESYVNTEIQKIKNILADYCTVPDVDRIVANATADMATRTWVDQVKENIKDWVRNNFVKQ